MPSASAPTHHPLPEPDFKRRGLMLVLASPPGGGKTTITRELMRMDPQTVLSVSATTREKRPGEIEGQHYFFVSHEEFNEMLEKGEMLEHALVYNGQMYGIPKAPVEDALNAGLDVMFDIDWQGNRRLVEVAPTDVVSIFLLPPTWGELEKRLHGRARDSEEDIARRLSKAQDEISHYTEFQYVIVNRDLDESIAKVRGILEAERLKRHRQLDVAEFVKTLKP